jgi:hypothetical protein
MYHYSTGESSEEKREQAKLSFLKKVSEEYNITLQEVMKIDFDFLYIGMQTAKVEELPISEECKTELRKLED